MTNTLAARKYSQVGVASQGVNASPSRLVMMLLEGAISRIGSGYAAISGNDFAGKSRELNKAIDIVAGLRASLDFEKGGKIAKNLSNVYLFVEQSLITVIASNDLKLLAECRNNLSTIREGWTAVVNQYDQPSEA